MGACKRKSVRQQHIRDRGTDKVQVLLVRKNNSVALGSIFGGKKTGTLDHCSRSNVPDWICLADVSIKGNVSFVGLYGGYVEESY